MQEPHAQLACCAATYLGVPVGIAIEDKDSIEEVEVVDAACAVEQESALVHGVVGGTLAPPDISLSGRLADHALVLGGTACMKEMFGRDSKQLCLRVAMHIESGTLRVSRLSQQLRCSSLHLALPHCMRCDSVVLAARNYASGLGLLTPRDAAVQGYTPVFS